MAFKMKSGMIFVVVTALISLVIMFQASAEIIPLGQTQGDLIDDTGRCSSAGGVYNGTTSICYTNSSQSQTLPFKAVPLGGFFGSSGVVFLLILAGLLFVVLASMGLLKKQR